MNLIYILLQDKLVTNLTKGTHMYKDNRFSLKLENGSHVSIQTYQHIFQKHI